VHVPDAEADYVYQTALIAGAKMWRDGHSISFSREQVQRSVDDLPLELRFYLHVHDGGEPDLH
jgi:hypothetical protein